MKDRKKDDKRRIPYNIWINVVGAVMFLAIASVGVFIISTVVTAGEEVNCYSSESCSSYSNSNWQLIVVKVFGSIIGVIIAVPIGIASWVAYVENHYWHKGE